MSFLSFLTDLSIFDMIRNGFSRKRFYRFLQLDFLYWLFDDDDKSSDCGYGCDDSSTCFPPNDHPYHNHSNSSLSPSQSNHDYDSNLYDDLDLLDRGYSRYNDDSYDDLLSDRYDYHDHHDYHDDLIHYHDYNDFDDCLDDHDFFDDHDDW